MVDDLKNVLRYDPETGHFWWLPNGDARGKRFDEPAGWLRQSGYRVIRFEKRYHYAHRLAWWWVHGEVPSMLDHINMDPDDNRIENLRPATHSQNGMNRRASSNNTSGLKGVHWNKVNRKWRAMITNNGKQQHLGLFDCKYEAHAAYCQAARELFGEYAREG